MKSLLIFFAALSSLAGQTSLPTPSETLLWDFQDRAQASGAVWTTAQFETWPGAVYTLQSSSDLETWQPLQSFYALSNQLDLGLFEKEPAPPSNDPSPPLPPFPSNEPIPNASFFLRPSADGTFTTVSFPSPVDGVLVYQTLPAPLVAEWDSQPFYMDEHSGHFLFVAALHGSPAVNFQVTTLLPEEEPYFDALANNFAQIQALVVSNAATAAANPIVPPPPNPHAKRFYRLERSFPDSDYDGIPDWIEFLTAGMDAFNPDSDGDGADDGIDSDLDTDGDGLNNSEEALFGTNPLKPDSDGDGILDPQDAAPVFVSITRQAAYDYEDYLPEDNPIKNLTTSANWPTATATSETLSALIPYHQLAGTLASKQSFPATFPAGVLDKKLQAGGTAETLPPPPGFCYHVEKLTHRQIIALAPSAVPYERRFPYLIVTKRTINGEVQTPAVTPGSSPLIIPATEKKSQTVELAPSFLNSGENSEESTENYTETVTATLLPVEIVPDEGQAGVTGDVIPSNNGAAGENHYVSPKKSDEIPNDFVVLKAKGIEEELFEELLEWEAGEAVPDEPLKRRIPRDATGKTVVKIKVKDGGQEALKMNVWIVWSEITTVNNGVAGKGFFTQETDPNAGAFARWWVVPNPANGRSFTCVIKPASIITDAERPALDGKKTKPVPGENKQFVIDNRKPDEAENKWDMSRRFLIEVENPGGILRGQLGEPAALFLNQPENAGDPAIAIDTPVQLPQDPVEGNDDPPPVNPQGKDEDTNPYQARNEGGQQAHINHQVGEMASFDSPQHFVLNSWGVNGRIYRMLFNYQEFARVELWDSKRADGNFWFRISDHFDWHHDMDTKYTGSPLKWIDNGSSAGVGHK